MIRYKNSFLLNYVLNQRLVKIRVIRDRKNHLKLLLEYIVSDIQNNVFMIKEGRMNFKSCFWVASKMLFSNKLKTMLPVLGILMGIASVITIYSVAEGGKAAVEKDLAFLAENRVMIGVSGENVSKRDYISIEDIEILESLPGVSYTYIPAYEIDLEDFFITGLTFDAISEKNLIFISGNSGKLSENEILIDEKFAAERFGTPYAAGRVLELGATGRKARFVVRGVYKSDDSLLDRFAGQGIVDYKAYRSMIGSPEISRVLVAFEDGEDADELSPMVISTLEKLHRKKGIYTVMEASEKYKRVENIKKTMNLFLAAIGLVSLAFGGIGISNLMVITVRERISQIGILRAMGASKEFILLIFLIKSTVLSLTGGVLGLASGYAGGKIVGRLIGIAPIFFAHQFILAALVSVLLGILFGVVPAKKAAHMDPVEALKVNL